MSVIAESRIIEEDVLNVDLEESAVEDSDNVEPDAEIISGENDNDTESETEEDPDGELEEDDVVVTIGDEAPEKDEHAEAPGWVKTVRKKNRELEKRNRELEKKLKQDTENKPVELGEKPTLEKCGFDDKVYESKLIGYYDRKRKVDEQNANLLKQQEVQKEAWNGKMDKYNESKKSHSFKNFEDAEAFVTDTFNTTQQGIMVQGADDSALLIYALGKNPKKAKELALITDPVDFAFKVAKLEAQLKVTSKKKAPSPEQRVSGGKAGGISGTVDKTLDRLRTEAEKTGDYTKVSAYKRKIRNK